MAKSDVSNIPTFGEVAAEDDAILEYFVQTDSVDTVVNGIKFLILGRKGSGKTALFRYFNERQPAGSLSLALNLRGYPWAMHARRNDPEAATAEQYEASWKYVIVTEFAQMVLSKMTGTSKWTDQAKSLQSFFQQNYGGINVTLDDILRPVALQLSKASFEPTILGCKLFSISLERDNDQVGLSRELNALSDAIFEAASYVSKREGLEKILLHFDELDQGMVDYDEQRQLMLIGLILACRSVNQMSVRNSVSLKSIVYLRSDMWERLTFSDKNKITMTNKSEIKWGEESLRRLIDLRIQKYIPNATWTEICDDELMRGRQPKLTHIVARTFDRPRDVISFMNNMLEISRERRAQPGELSVFTNKDVVAARTDYSNYLKAELDDEINPHWEEWSQALLVISGLGKLSFTKSAFTAAYNATNLAKMVPSEEAIKVLYEFSVVGTYKVSSGYGGSGWSFRYKDTGSKWDENADSFKLHLGLKEYAGVNE
ncbi:P-loop ATPase, Sll1717 family [Pseudomonas sp. Pseusp16]|uniref:P-loop ATPase, Sll1717 family n=1 Tax=Pseudomonas sp. Pseusp16 TaxID=3243021 RepID=UPI0039B4DE98